MKNIKTTKQEKIDKKYLDARSRAKSVLTESMKKFLYSCGYHNVLTCEDRTMLKFNCFQDGELALRVGMVFSTRWHASYKYDSEDISAKKIKRWEKIAARCHKLYYATMYFDGHTSVLNLRTAEYEDGFQYVTKRTIGKGDDNTKHKEKTRVYARSIKPELDFDAKWVYDGYKKEESKDEEQNTKALF